MKIIAIILAVIVFIIIKGIEKEIMEIEERIDLED